MSATLQDFRKPCFMMPFTIVLQPILCISGEFLVVFAIVGAPVKPGVTSPTRSTITTTLEKTTRTDGLKVPPPVAKKPDEKLHSLSTKKVMTEEMRYTTASPPQKTTTDELRYTTPPVKQTVVEEEFRLTTCLFAYNSYLSRLFCYKAYVCDFQVHYSQKRTSPNLIPEKDN